MSALHCRVYSGPLRQSHSEPRTPEARVSDRAAACTRVIRRAPVRLVDALIKSDETRVQARGQLGLAACEIIELMGVLVDVVHAA